MNNDAYSQSLDLIRGYTSGMSIDAILLALLSESPDVSTVSSIINRMITSKSFPDTIHGFLILMNGLLHKRKEVVSLYEVAMEKYNVINQNIAKTKRPTDDEIKIKGTLSDFIIKIESLFENHDRADESMVNTLNSFLNEANLHGKADVEILYMNVSSYLVNSLLEPLSHYGELYQFYTNNLPIIQRLINIANLILEESN